MASVISTLFKEIFPSSSHFKSAFYIQVFVVLRYGFVTLFPFGESVFIMTLFVEKLTISQTKDCGGNEEL